MIASPRRKLLNLAACTALASCCCACSSPSDVREPPIKGAIKFNDSINGLQLEVTNPKDDALCIPVPSLSAQSGSLKVIKAGIQQIPERQSEYGSTLNGYGPFYIVSARSRTVLPLDSSALKLEDGAYDVILDMAWVKCRSIASDQKHDMNILSRATFSSKVQYKPFR